MIGADYDDSIFTYDDATTGIFRRRARRLSPYDDTIGEYSARHASSAISPLSATASYNTKMMNY